jgi:hypothetical protein
LLCATLTLHPQPQSCSKFAQKTDEFWATEGNSAFIETGGETGENKRDNMNEIK